MKTIPSLLGEIHNLGIKFCLEGDKLGVKAAKGVLTDALRKELSTRKTEIIAYLQQLQAPTATTAIPIVNRNQPLSLSFSQQRLWLLHQLADQKQVYNIPCIWHLQGELLIPALENSLNQIVLRHESLRTIFVEEDGKLWQKILPELHVPLQILASNNQEQAQRQVQQLIDIPFHLECAPLLRAHLLCMPFQKYLLILNLHHIIADSWSLDVLVKELGCLYAQVQMPDLPIQYADFAHWQRQAMQQGEYANQLKYWQQQLADIPTLLNLPIDRPHPPRQNNHGKVHDSVLPLDLLEKLKKLAIQTDTTLFMVLQAAFAVLMGRYSGQNDVLLGSPIANRNRVETEGLIGCFINTIVLRTKLDNNPSFSQLLTQVRKTTLDAYQNQDLPFDVLVETLHPERTKSNMPLFQVMLVLQNTQTNDLFLPGLEALKQAVPSDVAALDLTLSLQESSDGMVGSWEYATAKFDADTIARMAANWQVLLAEVVSNPNLPVFQIPLLTVAERQLLLLDWNANTTTYPRDVCLHELFAQQAAKTPDAIAVIVASAQTEQRLSYMELDTKANCLAFELLQHGVKPDDLIGICIERSIETYIAVLGVLKSGAAYVPLDPNYPPERLNYMIEDAKIKILLTKNQVVQILEQNLEQNLEQINCHKSIVKPHNLAYVIYTSGSTGLPKGVMISQLALQNRVLSLADSYALNSSDRVLQFAAFSFDVAAEEIFPTWLRGGCVVIAPQDCTYSVPKLVKFVQLQHITVLNLPAPYWHEWVMQLATNKVPDTVRLVITGSDKVLKSRLQRWQQHSSVPVYCGYGPTEATITATLYTEQNTTRGLTDSVLIGRPLPDTKAYILDQNQQLVPIGVPGELYLGGIALARGYLHRDDLTAEKFIPNPFQDSFQDSFQANNYNRLYKTGDLTRYLPDGNIEFLGRMDAQVKIRGFRIELGEITAVLQQHVAVREAVVLAKTTTCAHAYLVAYVVAEQAVELIPQLRELSNQHLPDYMIPTAFVVLDSMPLTASGKIDVSLLPEPGLQTELAYEAPRTTTEQLVATIWQDLLNVSNIGIHDNFFELGGHSLLITNLLYQVVRVFKVDLPVNSLFNFPTLEAFAKNIDSMMQGLPGLVVTHDFHAEVTLDDDIVPQTADLWQCSIQQAIFLTGATGFVGAFLLHELLQQTQAQIYCLVRASNIAQGLQRLQTALTVYGLWQENYRNRLVLVLGDLSLPRFGLDAVAFDNLAQQIDVIYHNGAWVNHVYPYSVLKAANVAGTQESLRLACRIRTKPLHFISSLSVFAPEITEIYEDAELTSPELLENGYVETKWVADKIVSLAGQRGVPVTIYRISGILGILANDRFAFVRDNFYRYILTAVQLGIWLDNPVSNDSSVPVDYACRAILQLSSQSNLPGKVFHIGNQPSSCYDNFAYNALLDLGYNIRLLAPPQWKIELLHHTKNNPEIGLYPLLSLFTNYDFSREPEHILFDDRNTQAGLAGSGINCPIIDQQDFINYFTWLIQQGHLPVRTKL
jgi:amino acid adenylation domain-containing protein/thioester reductase-like protein